MLKMKLQYFGHLLCRRSSLEKTLMLDKIEGKRRRGRQRMRWLDASPTQWTWVWASSRVGDGQGSLVCCSLWGHKESNMSEWLNWTELKKEVTDRQWDYQRNNVFNERERSTKSLLNCKNLPGWWTLWPNGCGTGLDILFFLFIIKKLQLKQQMGIKK